jgi:hypothetical protein
VETIDRALNLLFFSELLGEYVILVALQQSRYKNNIGVLDTRELEGQNYYLRIFDTQLRMGGGTRSYNSPKDHTRSR